jgi:RNA polymerase sigma-B factor
MARKPTKFKMNAEQQKLASDNLNLARREAWRIQRSTGIDYQTLESVAFEGLCKAAYRYDPSRPHPVTGKSMKFSSLATPTIRGELLHWVRDRTYAMRLSHKMRERWVKGRKLLYAGSSDIQIAKALDIKLEEWQEVRKVCSGPPLELKDQATPTEALEPDEINFATAYLTQAEIAMEELAKTHGDQLDQIELFLTGTGRRIPREAVDAILEQAGCATTDWSQTDINLLEGWQDIGDNRYQGSLF